MSKVILRSEAYTAIDQFTGDVLEIIDDFRDILIEVFNGFYEGKCGEFLRTLIDHLFDEWLVKNLNPNTVEITQIILSEFDEDDIEAIERNLMRKLGDFNNINDIIIEIMAYKSKGENIRKYIRNIIYRVFEEKIQIFVDQTAIQLVGRYLMLYVGIDKKAWKSIETPQNISNIFLRYYWIIRTEMTKVIPSIYNLNELDWIYVSESDKQGLEPKAIRILDRYENILNINFGRMFRKLDNYDYSHVDSDIWKQVYQKILPKEEVNKLGFVNTPDEIVDVILDVIEYKSDNQELCNKIILDPACGSGTFLVNALSRLIKHLNTDLGCHQIPNSPSWKTDKAKLEIILRNINGVDINPFATFLTTLNLVFMLMDLYSEVVSKDPYFSLELKIITSDSLTDKLTRTTINGFENARRSEAIENMKKFIQLLRQKFDYVIGNPPWGTVLRGKLGPLGSEEKRAEYKKQFKSATGKYDIYVLFMERGIELLRDNGTLGFITQVNYVSQDYGDGIKQVIKKSGSITKFIDMQRVGQYIFPQWTNYPAITIFKKGVKQGEIDLIEVKPSE